MDLLKALHDEGDPDSDYNDYLDGWLSWKIEPVEGVPFLTIIFVPYDYDKGDDGPKQVETYALIPAP